MPLALLFPGQNSRYPEMLEKLVSRDGESVRWLERASDVLGRSICDHYRADNPNIFAHNRDVQIGVFLANHLHWQLLEREGVRAHYSAGLSLGEYNHLVHIGALDFDDALRILNARGEAYEAAPRGVMIAVFPVSTDEVQCVLEAKANSDAVAIGMFNTPQQCVLSGEREAVEHAAALIADECYAQTAVVDERLPMHSPVFSCVTDQLRPHLEAASWRSPSKPYLPNVTGQFTTAPSMADVTQLLSIHPCRPVRWRDSIESLARESQDMVFVETGPKTVLTKFFAKRWLNPRRHSTDADGDLSGIVEELKEFSGGIARAARAD